VELGSLPLAFHRAIEETVRETLRGRGVIDCLVTLTHTRFYPPLSTAGDFRGMTQLVLREGVRRAGTRVHEPVNTFEAEVPTAAVSAVLRKLIELRAVPGEPAVRGAVCTVDGTIPAASVHELEQALPALTQGEGVFFSEFGEYRPR
jgi:ribosomal protection tetracycline resistance protein